MIILGKHEEKKQKQQAGFSFVEPPNPGFGGASCLLILSASHTPPRTGKFLSTIVLVEVD